MPIRVRLDIDVVEFSGPSFEQPVSVRFDELAKLVTVHRTQWEPPERLENWGKRLIGAGFPTDESRQFAAAVFRWGGGHRLIGRFLEQNEGDAIPRALDQAEDLAARGCSAEGVERIIQLRFIRQSFASKLLRFLCPQNAVILDDVLRKALAYEQTADGYRAFLSDCHAVLMAVRRRHLDWRVCDIESAIFAKLQGY